MLLRIAGARKALSPGQTPPPAPVPGALIITNGASAAIDLPGTLQLTVSVVDTLDRPYTDDPVTYASDDTGVATVSAAGLITAVAGGDCIVTASCTDGTTTVSDTINIGVTAPPVATSLVVTPSTATVLEGATTSLTAQVLDQHGAAMSGEIVTWGSDDEPSATVGADNGAAITHAAEVLGVAAGDATITATSGALTDTCLVTVQAVVGGGFTIPVTGVILDVEWPDYVGAGNVSTWTITPDGQGTIPMNFGAEGNLNALGVSGGTVVFSDPPTSTGTATAYVSNDHISLVDDPIFTKALRVSHTAGWNHAFGGLGSNDYRGVAPHIGLRFADSTTPEYTDLWFRNFIRYGAENGVFSIDGVRGSGARSWKMYGFEPANGSIFKMSHAAGPNYANESNLSSGGAITTLLSKSTWSQVPGDTNWNNFYTWGALRSGPSYDGTENTDGNWYEQVTHVQFPTAKTAIESHYRRRLTGTCLKRQVSVNAPDAYGNVDVDTASYGWIHDRWSYDRSAGADYKRVFRYWLSRNRNKANDTTNYVYWGRVTIVDGTVNSNPFGIPAGLL